jgi:hypothetical protein
MANKDVTSARVKNVMKHIPRDALKKGGKMRRTLQGTFTGMKTLLGQFSKEKTDYRGIYLKKKKRQRLIKLAIVVLILLAVMIAGMVIFILFI